MDKVDVELEVWGTTMLKDDPGTFRRAWVIRGPEGAVHFVYGDWHPDAPPEARAIDTTFMIKFGHPLMPMGYDVGYHSLAPMNGFHIKAGPANDECEWLDGRPCYCDGSALHAARLFTGWIEHDRDMEWLFDYLREYYCDTFRSDGNGPVGLTEMVFGISQFVSEDE